MERYKVIFEFENGKEETAYFNESPVSRVNDWVEREKGHWARVENSLINLENVNVIKVALVELDPDGKEDKLIEWV
jgi:hypothetical protein